ncbi:tripartite tricarboxylate transporter substrate-binding protein [Malikia granosa]|uniref:tripartite tricarboxylate transporter substrate-binding protein n=1 Tax=Malikia granosa TaxID=263067 RepID=UPI001FEB3BB9|nr:tripartite tricarboxylate transporter substrate-binding protein [Malikia granosa]
MKLSGCGLGISATQTRSRPWCTSSATVSPVCSHTPPEIIGRYHAEIVRILKSPEIQKRLHEMEFEVVATTPREFSDWIGTEITRWGKVIKSTGAKVE